MSSRSLLTLGLIVAVGVAVGLWFAQTRSEGTPPVAVPAAPGGPPDAPGATVEWTRPGKPATVAADPEPSRATATAEPSVTEAIPDSSAETSPEVGEVEPPKPTSLEPIHGGPLVIASKFQGSTYQQRADRVSVLEAGLVGGDPPDPEQFAAYQALKEELYWLRDNLGAPPAPTPKK